MLDRISAISGARILSEKTGKQLGVAESVICTGTNGVFGLLLQTGGFQNRYGFVCVEDIASTEAGRIYVFHEDCVQKNKKQIQQYRKEGAWKWLNRKAVTPDGKLLGTISDGLFDVREGKISQIELSLGVMEDLREGRRRLCLTEDTEFGKEFLVLKEDGRQYE